MPDNAIAAEVNPNAGFDRLNSVIGLQGGMLGLTRARQALAGQAAEVQQQQIKAEQQQGASDFFSAFDPSEHPSADGTTDVDSVIRSPAFKNAGNAKPIIQEALIRIKQGQLQNKQALQTLDDATLNQMARGVGALANDDEVKNDTTDGRKKVEDYYRNFAAQSPEAARIAGLYGQVVQHAPQGKLGDAVYAQQLMGADVLGQRSQQNPNVMANAAGQPILAQPRTGAISAAPGVTYPQGLTPSAPQVAGATAREHGVAGTDIDTATEIRGLQQASSAAIPLTKRIDELAQEINSGHLAKMISESGNYLGFSSVNEARSQLNKDLGQVKGLAVARAGSDSRAATILEGYPSDTTPESTIHAAMDYIRGTAKQNLARGKLLNQYQTQDPTGLRGLQAADTHLSSVTDPLMHEYLSLSPKEQAGFYRRNFSSKEEAQAFKNKVNALKSHSKVFD